MNRGAAIALATERVLAVQLDHYRRGQAPVDYTDGPDKAKAWIAREAERHADEIRRATAEILNPARSQCWCGAPATTVVQGVAFCEPHAATVPRLARPQGK